MCFYIRCLLWVDCLKQDSNISPYFEGKCFWKKHNTHTIVAKEQMYHNSILGQICEKCQVLFLLPAASGMTTSFVSNPLSCPAMRAAISVTPVSIPRCLSSGQIPFLFFPLPLCKAPLGAFFLEGLACCLRILISDLAAKLPSPPTHTLLMSG